MAEHLFCRIDREMMPELTAAGTGSYSASRPASMITLRSLKSEGTRVQEPGASGSIRVIRLPRRFLSAWQAATRSSVGRSV